MSIEPLFENPLLLGGDERLAIMRRLLPAEQFDRVCGLAKQIVKATPFLSDATLEDTILAFHVCIGYAVKTVTKR